MIKIRIKDIFFILLIVALIFVHALFTSDNSFFINAMYIIFCLGSLIHGFITSRYYTLNMLSFGITRRSAFNEFLQREVFVMVMGVTIAIIYKIFYLIIYSLNTFNSLSKELYFISCYMLCASLGYFQGIFHIKQKLFIGGMIITSIIFIALDYFHLNNYVCSFIILLIATFSTIINLKIISRINILN